MTMRMCGAAAALLVATAALPATAHAAPDALAAIDACTDQLNGYDRIASRCPELLKTLEASAWSAWLPPGWRDQYDDMSASSFIHRLSHQDSVSLLFRETAVDFR